MNKAPFCHFYDQFQLEKRYFFLLFFKFSGKFTNFYLTELTG